MKIKKFLVSLINSSKIVSTLKVLTMFLFLPCDFGEKVQSFLINWPVALFSV